MVLSDVVRLKSKVHTAPVVIVKPKKDIEIQGLQWENMQDLLKLKVEMKQYQNINLTMGNLPSFPLVNMHMANDLTNEMKQKEFEKRIFENINSILVLKEGFCTMSNKPLSYDLLILFSAFYLNEFRKSNIPNTFLLKNRPGLILLIRHPSSLSKRVLQV